MNKLSIATLASVLALSASSAFAATADYNYVHPYIGVEYNAMKMSKHPTITNHYNGIAPNIGVNVGEYFGVELGYLHTPKTKKSFDFTYQGTRLQGSTKSKVTAVYADLNGYLPLSKINHQMTDKVSLMGTVGVGRYHSTDTLRLNSGYTTGSKNNETKFRAGAGLNLRLDKHINLRALVRYTDFRIQDAETGKKGRGTWIGALGVSIQY